jgi:hypothetical protein
MVAMLGGVVNLSMSGIWIVYHPEMNDLSIPTNQEALRVFLPALLAKGQMGYLLLALALSGMILILGGVGGVLLAMEQSGIKVVSSVIGSFKKLKARRQVRSREVDEPAVESQDAIEPAVISQEANEQIGV